MHSRHQDEAEVGSKLAQVGTNAFALASFGIHYSHNEVRGLVDDVIKFPAQLRSML